MVNNSTSINKTNNHLSPQIIEHKQYYDTDSLLLTKITHHHKNEWKHEHGQDNIQGKWKLVVNYQLIGKSWSEQVVFSGVRQTSVSAGRIVTAMHTIPPAAKKGGVY